MSAAPKLPVSVLLPTRNSMTMLRPHLDAAHDWLPLVQEVVVVDSASTDGTAEFLRENLQHPSVRLLQHPPGLYESWNFGITRCAAEFIYISTVGDSITPAGLRRLVEVGEQFQCDVIISAPEIIDAAGQVTRLNWPVTQLQQALAQGRDVVLEPEWTWLFAVASMRKAILGSSASNLYRRNVLQARLFPTDYGHAGDVGWGLKYAPDVRLGVLAETVSTFVLHPRAKKVVADGWSRRLETSRQTLARVRERVSPETLALAESLCEAWAAWAEAQQQVQAARKKSPLAVLTPEFWRWRAAKARAEQTLAELQDEAWRRIAAQARVIR